MSQKKGENRRRGGQEALAGREIPHGGNISHTERGSATRRSIRLYMKPGEAWAPPGGFVMQSTPPCGQFLGSGERL